jgi:hypothetical protein
MKLKNKRTGEIVETVIVDHGAEWEIRNMYTGEDMQTYNSLAELNEEWEDYEEEEKEYYTLDSSGQIWTTECFNKESIKNMKSIGNYFDTREEAELAVRKLKAWKRLKDKGFRFDNVNGCWIEFTLKSAISDEDFEQGQEDLHLLFGGEE